MTTKTSIRVIKRGRGDGENAEAALKSNETATASALSVVRATVSTWVRESQQQRRTDPKRAFRSLFEDQALHPEAG